MLNNIFGSLVYLINTIVGVLLGVAWIAGFVIAKGFWATFFCWLPFYSWYLVVEKIMVHYNLT